MTADGDFPHLPPGREPGPQSLRNRQRRTRLAPFVGFVGTAMFAAGVWVAAGGRGDRFDRQEELLGGVFFAGMGLLVVYGAMVISTRGQPKRHPRLHGTTLSGAADVIRRGDPISVTFAGRRADGDRLEIGIACGERYDTQVQVQAGSADTTTRQTGEATVHEEWQAPPPGVAEHTFTFQVPRGAPYSYEGDCVSYAWRISARAARRLRHDARHDQAIWVQP